MVHSGISHHQRQTALDQERQALRCVARVIVRGIEVGSGVLLPDHWFLTCQHVISSAADAGAATSFAQFDYRLEATGTPATPVEFYFDASSYVSSPYAGGNDWALVKLKPHDKRGLASVIYEGGLSLEKNDPVAGATIAIIQHPLGEYQKKAESQLTAVAERLQHSVSTEGGSSGSPIFDAQWRIIGLHQGVHPHDDLSKQGIPISTIIDGITAAGKWPLERQGLEIEEFNGPMPPDSEWYIEREADRIAEAHLLKKKGITVALEGTTQLGKSSLANRLEAALARTAPGWKSASIDLRGDFSDDHFGTAHNFFRRLAEEILQQSGGVSAALQVFERDGTPGAFAGFLNELGRDVTNPLLLIMDRVDMLVGRACCTPVFSGLLVAHNAQSRLGAKRSWFKMILITTLTPRQTDDLHGSIFVNAAKIIKITDYDLLELHHLIMKYGNLRVDAERLHGFLGGNPALSRLALNELAVGCISLDELIRDAEENGGIFRPHLDQIVSRFRRMTNGITLADEFRRLVAARPGEKPLSSEEVFEALLALGVVSGTDRASARPRSALYCSWLPEHLPPR